MKFLPYFVTLILVSQAAVSNYQNHQSNNNNHHNYQNNRSNHNRFLNQNNFNGRYPQNNNYQQHHPVQNSNYQQHHHPPPQNNYFNGGRNQYRPTYPLQNRHPINNGRPQYQPPKSISPNQFQYRGYEFTVLNYVNGYRHTHQAESMSLDRDLNSRAQSCAEYYASRKTIDHSCRQKSGAGENLYMMFTSTASSDAALRAIQAWYKENRLYDSYNRNPREFSTGTGHFTQLIWKESEKLGIGVATVGSRTVVVGLFYPPGNYIGKYKNNVLPPLH